MTTEFKDQTFIIGSARNNRHTGYIRHFNDTQELLNVTDAATGNFFKIKLLLFIDNFYEAELTHNASFYV